MDLIKPSQLNQMSFHTAENIRLLKRYDGAWTSVVTSDLWEKSPISVFVKDHKLVGTSNSLLNWAS